MGLFKDKALGKTYKCCMCGASLHEIVDGGIDAKLRLMKKGYRWDSVYKCRSCGAFTCMNCMRMRMICKCGNGNLIVLPIARK